MRAESSPAARRGAFIAVAVVLFCVQLDFFALTGMITLSHVTAWWLYVPVFARCGLGLGPGRAFAGVATQQVVAPERAGEASGVLLTFLVTLGGVALAGAAAAITAMVPERSPDAAYDAVLRFGGAVILAASVVVMAVRHRLVVRGSVPPLGPRASRGGRLP
ncbi:hypothetical protein [Streptomyces cadmiisoli]|uniref:hypothetical protein n=1 Tax=Streptomyces cadmiisoli TaxID=2184053 RepID=UPI00366A1C81